MHTINNMYLAGFLITSGFPLASYHKKGNSMLFDFAETGELHQLINEYYGNQVKVSPLDYTNALRNLKSLIYGDNLNMNSHGKQE